MRSRTARRHVHRPGRHHGVIAPGSLFAIKARGHQAAHAIASESCRRDRADHGRTASGARVLRARCRCAPGGSDAPLLVSSAHARSGGSRQGTALIRAGAALALVLGGFLALPFSRPPRGLTKMEPAKAIFWDNDGVLVDTEHLGARGDPARPCLGRYALTREDYVELLLVQGKAHGKDRRRRHRSCRHRAAARNETVFTAICWRKRLASFPALPGARRVAGKYVMGIVTSSRKDHFDVITDHGSVGIFRLRAHGQRFQPRQARPRALPAGRRAKRRRPGVVRGD